MRTGDVTATDDETFVILNIKLRDQNSRKNKKLSYDPNKVGVNKLVD